MTAYFDRCGIPHVFADSINDAAVALGYIHASERLFQMEVQRRAGQGRLAEILGIEFLEIDKFIRTLNLHELSDSSFRVLSSDAQSYILSYCAGINDFLTSHSSRLPPEFLLLGVRPEPWKAADTVVWGKLMAWQMSRNYVAEVNRGELQGKLSPDQAKLFYPTSYEPADLGGPHDASGRIDIPDLDKLGDILGMANGASNAWVIKGHLTDTGRPILANDPHLDVTAPVMWFLARIVTPDGWVKGAGVPGVPMILLGQNDHLAWGTTASMIDTQDIFLETVDPNDSRMYAAPGGFEPFITREERIKVRGREDVTITVRVTRHGPVLSDVVPRLEAIAGADRVAALSFSGLGAGDRTAEAFMKINWARDLNQFTEALRIYSTPSQNIFYADFENNIGAFSIGLTPTRRAGRGLSPVPGSSGEYDWNGYIDFEKLPQSINPARGYIFNANGPLEENTSSVFVGMDWEEPYRTMRLKQLFDAIDGHSLLTSAAMQADEICLAFADLWPVLSDTQPISSRAKHALELLSQWDGRMSVERPEPLIFQSWLQTLKLILVDEQTGLSLEHLGSNAATLVKVLLDKYSDYCKLFYEAPADRAACLTRSLEDSVERLSRRYGDKPSKWRWGDAHITTLKHTFYKRIPLLGWISDLSRASGGGLYTLNSGGAFRPDPKYPFERKHVPGFRGLYDLADPSKSRFMIATGQSGHIFSRFYRNLLPMWNSVESITITGSESDLLESGATVVRFVPKAR